MLSVDSMHYLKQLSYLMLETPAHMKSQVHTSYIAGTHQSYVHVCNECVTCTTEIICGSQTELDDQVALFSHENMLQTSHSSSGNTRAIKASVGEEKWQRLPPLLHGKVEAKEAVGQGYLRTAWHRGDTSFRTWLVRGTSTIFCLWNYKESEKLIRVLT